MRAVALSSALALLTLAAAVSFAAPAPSEDGAELLRPRMIAAHRATPARPASIQSFSDPRSAGLAAGNRLANLQSDVTEDNAGNGFFDSDFQDGGWVNIVTGLTQHPATRSNSPGYAQGGPGIALAAIRTGSPRLATMASDMFAGLSQSGFMLTGGRYYRVERGATVAAMLWAANTGNAALRDTFRLRHDQVMADAGGPGARARASRNGRAGAGLPGLWPWDEQFYSRASGSLREAYPALSATYGMQLDTLAQVLLDDAGGALGPVHWNPTVFLQDFRYMGLAGALRTILRSPRTDDDALGAQIRDTLVAAIQPDDAWGDVSGGVYFEPNDQGTAYVVMALFEYAARTGDAGARAAAERGRNHLMSTIAPGGEVFPADEEAFYSGEALAAILAGDDVTAVPAAGTCISTATPCVVVPVRWTRTDVTPARGYSVTVQLSANLTLCGAQAVSGGYLLSGQPPGPIFAINPLGGNQYVIDEATLGSPCGASGDGTLFNLQVGSTTDSGTGTITVVSVIARDCSNHPIPAMPGPAASVTIDKLGPAPIADLGAAQVKTGNDGDGTTRVHLTGTLPSDATALQVYRAPYGNYPEYDDAPGSGSVPAAPSYPPPPPWQPTALTALPGDDETTARDFWYYVAFTRDACGNWSTASNRTGGTLNYHLGDVTGVGGPGNGDNLVATIDVTLLGAHYGALLAAGDPFGYLDVGPTTDLTVDARPTTDNRVDFEDLMRFAINYGAVSAPQFSSGPARSAERDVVAMLAPGHVRAGDTFEAALHVTGTGRVQGLSARLTWDESVATPVSVVAGDAFTAQGGVVFSAAPGDVDAALLGRRAPGLAGDVDVARVRFVARAEGDPRVAVAGVVARDAGNRPVDLDAPRTATGPLRTGLAAVTPNPFRLSTVLEYGLAVAGQASLDVYGLDGRRVRSLARGPHPPGLYHVTWDGRDDTGNAVRPGVYYARLVTAQGRFTRTFVHLR